LSEISKIFSAYQKALQNSQKRYEDLYSERSANAAKFYASFLKDLIRKHPSDKASAAQLASKIIGKDKIRFVAVDGHPYKDQLSDFAIFFAVAYGIPGEISLGSEPKVTYGKESLSRDISVVAYVPIPFAELDDIVPLKSSDVSPEEQASASLNSPATFATTDDERLNLANLHVKLMGLAEVFLLYKEARAEDHPDLLLWDQSISLQYQWVTHRAEQVPIIQRHFQLGGAGSRALTEADAYVALSHPYNSALDVPAAQENGLFFTTQRRFIYKLSNSANHRLSVKELATDGGVSEKEALRVVDEFLVRKGIATRDPSTNMVLLTKSATDSWQFVVSVFEGFCHRLFDLKDETALLYHVDVNEGGLNYTRQKWVSPDDIDFFIGVGLRVIMELSWQKGIMFVGVVKDSQQRYFTRNYLGVMGHIGKYSYTPILLPWTDRVTLEPLPGVDLNLAAPWSTIDYDSTFVTVHLYSETGKPLQINGGPGNLVAPERTIARSLAQFYLSRDRISLLYSHLLFIDRLLLPDIDEPLSKNCDIDAPNAFGKIHPFADFFAKDVNNGQSLTMSLLYLLSQNKYPEVIGYPEPLHMADWAAKTFSQKWAQRMIKSSGILLKSGPLARTFREVRDSSGR
jgi:hypothetical protein